MKLQYQTSSGNWKPLDDQPSIDSVLRQVLERETWYAPRVGREPMTTPQQVLDFLAAGGERGHGIRFDDDWYRNVRDADALPKRNVAPIEMVECDCGHSVPRPQAMRASLGTACPDCYDRMSG